MKQIKRKQKNVDLSFLLLEREEKQTFLDNSAKKCAGWRKEMEWRLEDGSTRAEKRTVLPAFQIF